MATVFSPFFPIQYRCLVCAQRGHHWQADPQQVQALGEVSPSPLAPSPLPLVSLQDDHCLCLASSHLAACQQPSSTIGWHYNQLRHNVEGAEKGGALAAHEPDISDRHSMGWAWKGCARMHWRQYGRVWRGDAQPWQQQHPCTRANLGIQECVQASLLIKLFHVPCSSSN